MAAIIRGKHAERMAELDMLRMVAYEQAQLIAYAFHDPKKMPKFVARAKAEVSEVDPMEYTVNDARVRGWFIGMSMQSAH